MSAPTPAGDQQPVVVPEVWRADHTALVHVLWEAKHQGLTLEDSDELARLIRSSEYQRAVQELSAAGKPPVLFDPTSPYAR